jgi:putative addiction module component
MIPGPEDETPFIAIPDWQREILAERLADLERNPEDEQDWEEVKAELWPKT